MEHAYSHCSGCAGAAAVVVVVGAASNGLACAAAVSVTLLLKVILLLHSRLRGGRELQFNPQPVHLCFLAVQVAVDFDQSTE